MDMTTPKEVFVGIDVAKLRNAVAIADAGRDGEIRYMGEFDASPENMTRLIRKLTAKHDRLHFCYEAGPTGYGLYRQIVALGHECIVVAPSLIPRRSGDRVKTDRRDAQSLARLLRAGELTAVWVPDETHEAVRDLVRTRGMVVEDYRRKRQHVSPATKWHILRKPSSVVVGLCRTLAATAGGQIGQSPPVSRLRSPWGEIVLRAYWLGPTDGIEQTRHIGITIERRVPPLLALHRRLENLPLTAREKQVCLLLARDLSGRQLAEVMGVAPKHCHHPSA
jgi:Transposase